MGNCAPEIKSSGNPEAVDAGEWNNSSDARKTESDAYAKAFGEAESWVTDQKCPTANDDPTCTTLHATITVEKPTDALYTGDMGIGKKGVWKSTCAWSATAVCEKGGTKGKKPKKKVVPPAKDWKTAAALSQEIACDEELYYEGTATVPNIQDVDCTEAEKKAKANASREARDAALRLANLVQCPKDCPVRLSEIWLGAAAATHKMDTDTGLMCIATGTCDYTVQVTCDKPKAK